jgi:DNA-directed RNA polymerase specialized sigma24 family protein
VNDWPTLPPHIRQAMREHCTPDEVQVLKLYAGGMGYRRIASALGISRDTARNRVQRGLDNLRDHLDVKELQ